MNETVKISKERTDSKAAKRDAKKSEIAASALAALQELGYANTSLRDIAAETNMSLGILHYYFKDRTELIIFCVQVYKRAYVKSIAETLEKAAAPQEILPNLSAALANSIIDDAMVHRLWYDIRTQALFDEVFRPVVAEIEAELIDLVRAILRKMGREYRHHAEMQYALLDGAFRYLMYEQFGNGAKTRNELRQFISDLLEDFLR